MLRELSQNNYRNDKIIIANYSRCSLQSEQDFLQKGRCVIPDAQRQKKKKKERQIL